MHSENSVSSRFSATTIISESAIHNSPAWKRILDVFLILLASPVVAPLMAIIAVYIRFVSRGPVFFKQERVGYRGGSFTLFKFRSMKANAEVKTHKDHTTHLIKRSDVPMIKMDSKGDARLIPGGSWLRASGLDELPQLLNVLRGEMSLVGPRPCVPYEYDQYLPWQKQRFDVAPGLTGLWQVSGKNLTTFNEMINLDLQYGEQRSLWLDLKIISKTIPALFEQVRLSRQMKKAARNSIVGVPQTKAELVDVSQ
jgi:lipopolysaccharide/colanic/teichoic acid biosynthesis glycosyltransferase